MHREVARIYVERRDFSVREVLEVVAIFAQPELLDATTEQIDSVNFGSGSSPDTYTMLGPIPRLEP